MKYSYNAYTKDKRVKSGTIQAASAGAAEEALMQLGFERVLSVRDLQSKARPGRLNLSLSSVNDSDILEFSRELANLLHAGITIMTALQLIEDQTRKPAFKAVLTDIAAQLRGGHSFAEAIGRHPETFSGTFSAVMQASGQSGDFYSGLKEMTDYLEKKEDMKKRIRRALSYPVFVVGVALAVGVLLTTMVLPQMTTLFESLGTNLPPVTRVVVAVASFTTNYKLYILAALVGACIAFACYIRVPSGKYNLDRLALRIPLVGQIVLRNNLLHFCRTSAMLLESGMQISAVLTTCVSTITNMRVRACLVKAERQLLQGQPFSQAMVVTGMLPQSSIETLVVGEKTGDLETALRNIASNYERVNNEKIDELVSMIEPVLTVAIGVGVGLIAIAIIAPMYSLSQGFQ